MIRQEQTELLAGVAPLAGRYDAWLCDIWGVLHNGEKAHPAAHAACSAFRRQGGHVVLITNAPRPHGSVAAQLERLGVPRSAYDAIVSSGDVTQGLVKAMTGQTIFHLGPERDLPIFEGTGARLGPAGSAEGVVCSGLFNDDVETPDDYATLLADFRSRDLPFICANPDIVVERGRRIVWCAGALARAYENLGGRVAYAGKPHAPIYEMAISAVARLAGRPIPRSRLLAIGDGLKTDMAGAAALGIATLFIPSAVHVPAGRRLDRELIAELFEEASLAPPVAAVDRLCW